MVGFEDYMAGRKAFLQALLDKPTIYLSGVAQEKRENAARANIEEELSRLLKEE